MRRPCTGRQCDVSLGMWGNDGRPAHPRLRAQAPSPSFTEGTYAVSELFDLSKRSMECVCDVRCAAVVDVRRRDAYEQSPHLLPGAVWRGAGRTCGRTAHLAGQSRVTSIAPIEPTVRSSFGEAFMAWLKIGCINFGGPAGQIALMHRVVVDEKKWVDEARFLHALNFCMLLPGPEAQKLATYLGWLLHGVQGGLT